MRTGLSFIFGMFVFTSQCLCQTINSDTITLRYFAPSFLRVDKIGFLTPKYKGDTVFEFKFYDKRDSITNDLSDFSKVYFISLFKNYIDSQHTYKDKDGKRLLLPVSKINTRYDRQNATTWFLIDYNTNKFSEIIEQRDIIMSSDTVIAYSEKGEILKQIFRYYATHLKL